MIITHTSEPITSRAGQVVELGTIQDGEVFTWPSAPGQKYRRQGDAICYENGIYEISSLFFAQSAHYKTGFRRLEKVKVVG